MDDFDLHESKTVEHLRTAASYFYGLATTEYKYQIVETPAYPDSPLALVKNEPNIDFVKVGSDLPQGARILTFDEICANEEALNMLMSWAIRLCFPDDD
jgi:hypothetical protein